MRGAILEIRALVQSVVVWCNGLYRRGNMAGRLQDKVTVVTGAGNGIGRATALRFAEEGSSVIVADIQIDKADETVQIIEDNGGNAKSISVDVTSGADNDLSLIHI